MFQIIDNIDEKAEREGIALKRANKRKFKPRKKQIFNKEIYGKPVKIDHLKENGIIR